MEFHGAAENGRLLTEEGVIEMELLKEQFHTLQTIIKKVPGYIFWKDRNSVLLGCNDAFASQVGLARAEDIVGKTDYDLPWSEEQTKQFLEDDERVMSTGVARLGFEEEQRQADGSIAYLLTSKVPMRDHEGKVTGILGIYTDITEKKKAAIELLEAKETAEAASRAKTEFLANMSHDVKTPLSGIIALSELLSHQLTADAKQKIEDIYLCGKKLMSFFENCIELSKMDIAHLQDVQQVFSFANIIESIHALFLPSVIAKKLAFHINLDKQLPAVLIGNQINIYRIILNLVGNAIKFTSTGSVNLSVILDCYVDDANASVKIIVQDTGIGIPRDKREVIFEKLQRLAPSYNNQQEGHGIGLYIVDQYVKAMHGTIEVESVESVGSTFTVTLPLKIASSDEVDIVLPPSLPTQEVPTAKVSEPISHAFATSRNQEFKKDIPRVLLVEDNPLIQTVTKQMLQTIEVHVDVASTGEEAMDLFEPGKYGLIYMDVGLPDMDGYEISQRLRAIEKQAGMLKTPILALTAHATVDIKAFCTGAGMQGVLNKPLSCKQAQQTFERYILNKTTTVVDGLTFLEACQPMTEYVSSQLQVIDLPGCVAIVETEARAREMLAMVIKLLDSVFVLEIQTAYEKNNDVELRKALHKFLGSLCYISTPLLKQATLDFQIAIKENLTARERAFQTFLYEVQQFKIAYSALKQVGQV